MSCPIAFDQRGAARPRGGACDLGAVEARVFAGRTIALSPGFNTLAWSGNDGAPAAQFASVVGAVEAVFAWDAATQEFRTWRPGAPPSLNSLIEIRFGDALWVLAGAVGARLELPARPIDTVPDVTLLRDGFNLVSWLGAEVAAPDRFDEVGDEVNGVWAWESATATFLTFFPAAPAPLNSLIALNRGEVLWVSVSGDAPWRVLEALPDRAVVDPAPPGDEGG